MSWAITSAWMNPTWNTEDWIEEPILRAPQHCNKMLAKTGPIP
jgi:hypothetical protein